MLENILKKIPYVKNTILKREYEIAKEYFWKNEKRESLRDILYTFVATLDTGLEFKAKSAQVFAKYCNMDCTQSVVDQVQKVYSGDFLPLNAIDILTDEDVFETIKLYDGKESDFIIKIIMRLLAPEKCKEYAKRISQDKICNALDQFRCKRIESLQNSILLSTVKDNYVDETIGFFEKFHDSDHLDIMAEVVELGFAFNKDNLRIFYLLVKYHDNHIEEFCEATRKVLHKKGPLDYSELLKSEVYEQIQKSKEPLKLIIRIMNNDYSDVRYQINNVNLRKNLSYDDLDQIVTARRYVEDLHRKRKDDHQKEVVFGFYRELNRAIDQSRDLKSKLSNLRTYCKEVQEKIREHAEELMVVTNA